MTFAEFSEILQSPKVGILQWMFCIFRYEVVQMTFLLLCLVRYLFRMAHGNRYLPGGTCSTEDVLSITIVGNVVRS